MDSPSYTFFALGRFWGKKDSFKERKGLVCIECTLELSINFAVL